MSSRKSILGHFNGPWGYLMKSKKEKVIGKITCIGRRLSAKGVKLIHVYVLEDKKEWLS
jgi:hypothetical protein